MSDVAQPAVEEPQLPQAGPPVQDPADAVADRILERRRERLTSTMYGASKVNPDKAALAQKLAQETGIGSGIALRHLDELMVDSRMREIERKNYSASQPAPPSELAAFPDSAARVAATSYGLSSGLLSALLPVVSCLLLWRWRPAKRSLRVLRASCWIPAVSLYLLGSPIAAAIWTLATSYQFVADRHEAAVLVWCSVSLFGAVASAVIALLAIPGVTVAMPSPLQPPSSRLALSKRISRPTRLWAFCSIMWVPTSLAFCFVFDPFGDSFTDHFPKVVVLATAPSALGAGGMMLYWLLLGRTAPSAADSSAPPPPIPSVVAETQ